MLRKAGFAFALMLSLPTFASAWTVTAKIGSGAGTITRTSDNASVAKAATEAAKTAYFKVADDVYDVNGNLVSNAVASQTLTVAPTPGSYVVSSVVIDGVNKGNAAGDYTINNNGKNHTMVVYYTAATTSISVKQPVAGGGSVYVQRMANGVPYGPFSRTGLSSIKPGSTIRVFAAPNADYTVSTIAGASKTGLAGQIKFADVVATGQEVTASFALVDAVQARVLASTVATAVGSEVTLDFSKTTANGSSVTYTLDPLANVTFRQYSGNKAKFKATAAGSYVVKVTASNGTASSTVQTPAITVYAPGVYGSSVCVSCHNNRNNALVEEYKVSGHANNSHGPLCSSCHVPGTTMHVNTLPEAGKACLGCHNGNYSKQFDGVTHFSNISTATFKNISAAYVGPKGQGVNACNNCHFNLDPHGIGAANVETFTTNSDILSAWAESDHGKRNGLAWTPTVGAKGHDWRGSGVAGDFQKNIPSTDCVRCHTAAGFAQFFGSNFSNANRVDGTDSALFNSPLTCAGCHTTDPTAVNGSTTGIRRTAAITPVVFANQTSYSRSVGVQTFYNISTVDKVTSKTVKARITAKFPDVGDSNLCVSCHSARLSGSALVTAQANGLSMNNSSFQNSHYMAAAGVMYVKAGFTAFTSASAAFGTSTYGKSLTADNASTPDGIAGGVTSTHRKLGTMSIVNDHGITATSPLTAGGPCVACHMGYNRNAAKGHSLLIGEDANGDAYKTVCINCHTSEGSHNGPVAIAADGSNFAAAFLDPNKEAFIDSLDLAKYFLLKNYKISYNPDAYPYFYDENLPKKNGAMQAVTDWTRGGALDAPAALKLEGAAFNLNLLSREPAAYVHARSYTRRLVYDSIDFLDDGVINSSVVTNAKTATSATGSVSGTVVDVTGKFTADTAAYTLDNGTKSTLGTIMTNTSEGMLFINAWDRTTGKWNTSLGKPERP
ncbi:NapC/NirT family cytochrome c [Geomonas sp. RF6]|uniref:NapC/NirT family cytochrome c n=1 Tax=Geomonas sp. RF6 TaxID=2897342 RepID=UPI001E413C86|nr:NapC/NirT family cytochrome c [Geomonas sp. RF6]UFS71031.1 NapC/NirT family cytochrome c [Geomonas sp. RF6]